MRRTGFLRVFQRALSFRLPSDVRKSPFFFPGPALNFGANHASHSNLTFLHADSLLPLGWDVLVASFLGDPTVSCAAFGFGVSRGASPPVPGIRFVELTANFRSRYFGLPYGDQCLSISRRWFDFVGGYPEQGLMEDYEIVSLLGRRARLVGGLTGERVVILPGPPVQCDDRRWRKLGVIRTCLTNSELVNKYNAGTGADELFEQYYGKKVERTKDVVF